MISLYLFDKECSASAYGIGTYINQLAYFISKKECIKLIVVELQWGNIEKYVVSEELEFRQIKMTLNISQDNEPNIDKYYKIFWNKLKKDIKQSQCDKLVFHFNYYQEYPLVYLAKRDFKDCLCFFTVHYHIGIQNLGGNLARYLSILNRTTTGIVFRERPVYQSYNNEKNLYSKIDKIVVLSEREKLFLTEIYHLSADKIRVIPNGMQCTDTEASPKERKSIRQRLFISEQEKVILFVGRLHDIKGVDILIEAFKQLLRQYPESHLYIIGDGENNKYIQQIHGYWSKITFTGRLSREEVYDFYRIADIGVIPSRYEPFGYVALEMMMFNVPMIVADTFGLGEIVEDGINGWKVPIEETKMHYGVSPEKLRDKIARILSGNYSHDNYNPRRYLLEHFSVEQMGEKYLALYNEAASTTDKSIVVPNGVEISVVMPTYNMGQYIREAIDSILKQTFKNFEYIIIDDGSTDETKSIVESYNDNRIIYIRNETNQGNYPARNRGMQIAKGKYIAVMDADDVDMPERLEIQYDYLEMYEEVLAIGTDFLFYDMPLNYQGVRGGKDDYMLREFLLYNNCLLHPSIMMRTEIVRKLNGYNENYIYASDYDLMCRILALGKMVMLPDKLVRYRRHSEQITQKHSSEQRHFMNEIRLNYQMECIKNLNLSGIAIPDKSALAYPQLGVCIYYYCKYRVTNQEEYAKQAEKMLDDIINRIDDRVPVCMEEGLCGFGCGLMYMIRNGFVNGNADDVLFEIDAAVIRNIEEGVKDDSWAFGLSGLKEYLQKRKTL